MPAPDHPWYGMLGKQKRPGRTISDDLTADEIKRERLLKVTTTVIDDETLRSARDPSYAPMTDGAAMRRPVRYD